MTSGAGKKRRGLGQAARAAAAVSAGVLLAVSFPPVAEAQAGWVALVPLILLARFTDPWPAFRWGFSTGAVFWLVSISWLLRLGVTGAPWPVAVLAWILLAGYCALYTAAFAMALSALFGRGAWGGGEIRPGTLRSAGLVVIVPLLWVGFEYLRSTLFTGFPWNTLGVSQFRNLAIIQLAQWGGVYAVSAVMAAMNSAVALLGLRIADVYFRRRTSRRFQVELMTGLLVFALCWLYGVRTVRRLSDERAAGVEVRIAAVQPAIPQLRKWPEDLESEILDRLGTLTRQASRLGLDLMIWPETAVPGALRSDPEIRAFVTDLAGLGTPLLVGSMEAAQRRGESEYYNSSFLVNTQGEITGAYRKQHLVPFGEYVPFRRIFPWIRRVEPLGFSCTAGTTNTVFCLSPAAADRAVSFSVLICFEDVMPYLARRAVREGAAFLVNQTNDAWFDGSSAALQHMSHCVFRCVENRVAAVRAANTGVTCFIDRTGRVEREGTLAREGWWTGMPRFETSRLVVAGGERPLPFYTRWGDRPFALPCGILAGAFFILVVAVETRKNARS